MIYVSREFVRNAEQIVQPNDILISLANSRELVGKTAIVKHRPVEATLGGFIGAIRPILIEPDFVNFFLCAPHVRAILIADASQTTNIANISGAKLNVITIPLPPLAEQKRIVAKVDELMALCDKLEAEQKNQRTLKTQAVQSTLHHLTSAENPASFSTSLNILERTFGNWFDDLTTVKHLRATILQLAVQGKLVPQNPTDEPASELLKRVEVEKKRLVKEGKIKPPKPLAALDESSQPYVIPDNWKWLRFGALVEHSEAGWSPKCEDFPRSNNNWGVLKVSAVSWGKFKPEENKALPADLEPRLEYEVIQGDTHTNLSAIIRDEE